MARSLNISPRSRGARKNPRRRKPSAESARRVFAAYNAARQRESEVELSTPRGEAARKARNARTLAALAYGKVKRNPRRTSTAQLAKMRDAPLSDYERALSRKLRSVDAARLEKMLPAWARPASAIKPWRFVTGAKPVYPVTGTRISPETRKYPPPVEGETAKQYQQRFYELNKLMLKNPRINGINREWQTFAPGTGAYNPNHNSYAMYLENRAMFDINPPQRRGGSYSLKSFGVTAPHWVHHGSFRSPQAAKAEAKRILESGEGAQRLTGFQKNPRGKPIKYTQLRGQKTGRVYAMFRADQWKIAVLKRAALYLARKHREAIGAKVVTL